MKKKRSLLLSVISLLMLTNQLLKAQGMINGLIKNADGKPLQFANILLLKQVDSSLLKGTLSDVSGKYSFKNIETGKYLITATYTGMDKAFTKIVEVTPAATIINLDTIYLRSAAVQLNTVTVAAKKSIFEQRIDRIIINVKNSITASGGSSLDVLEKSPGVTVNRQNNSISINGENGVTVMINGKITYMPMDALMQLLSGTSADNIEKIELITTPPAKYDAAGNAGFINIVFINNPYEGYNGSYFVTAGYGKKESGTAGINFNYRSAKINLYGNYAFKHDHFLQPGTGFTQFVKGGNRITNTSFSDRDAVQQMQNARIGIDYGLDTATIISALVSGYISHWTMNAVNGATVYKNNSLDTTISTFNSELNDWQNITTNLNLQRTFKPDKILYFDANYIYYKDQNPNRYSNTYYNNATEFISHEDLKSDKITPINFLVFSSDYTTPVGKKISMEIGAKISLSQFNNSGGVYKLKEEIYIPDTTLAANYLLKEKIAAVYTSFIFNPNSSISIKAGLRYEHSLSKLSTAGNANFINRKYGELFPTFYASKKFKDDNSISFSYSRRITRPAFTDLAPFTIFFDPKTFFSGNSALQPAIANTIRADYSFKNYIFSLSYTHENNTIESYYFQAQKIDTATNILYLSASNFNYEKYITASFSIPLRIYNWWNMQNNVNADWRKIATTSNNAPVQYKNFDYNFNSTQRFVLHKDLTVELTGFYSSAGYFGTTKFKPLFRIDAGLQKKLGNQKDVIRFTANDLFNSGSNYRFSDNLAIANATVERTFNFGVVACRLTYTHHFGNNALKGKRERSTAAEAELSRVRN